MGVTVREFVAALLATVALAAAILTNVIVTANARTDSRHGSATAASVASTAGVTGVTVRPRH